MSDFVVARMTLVARVKAILLRPKEAWPVIAIEPGSTSDLFMQYAVPLAAIGPVCTFLHGQIFGNGLLGFGWHPGLISGLVTMIVSYAITLVGLVVMAAIVNFLAPKFDGLANSTAATRLVIYGATAGFVAGFADLLPGLGILSLLGLYSLYLFYTGAAPMMKVPADKALTFTVVTVLCALVVGIVAGAIISPVLWLVSGPVMITSASGSSDTKIVMPGGGVFDPQKMQQAADQIQKSAENAGKKPPVAASALQALLPASVGSFQRTAVEATGVGAMGSTADGTYAAGGNTYHLKVTDMAAMGALAAGITGAMGIEDSKQDADSYEKTSTVSGHLQTEAWNSTTHSGKFGMLVGNRFMVEAEGSAGSIDDLKTAVATIDQAKLTALGA